MWQLKMKYYNVPLSLLVLKMSLTKVTATTQVTRWKSFFCLNTNVSIIDLVLNLFCSVIYMWLWGYEYQVLFKYVTIKSRSCLVLAGTVKTFSEETRNMPNSIVCHPNPQQDLEDPGDPDPDFTARPKRSIKLKFSQKGKKNSGSSKQHPLSCRHCRKTFTKLLQLRAHLAVHGASAEKPFQCSQCGRGFSFEHSLRAHLMLHTGESLASYYVFFLLSI